MNLQSETRVEGWLDVGNGHRLWYFDTAGDGEPVIMLHAGVGSAEFWQYQEPAFAARGYRMIAYSRRGHARSVVGDLREPAAASNDLLKLAEHLELGSFHLVATAAGGIVAADFAISQADRLNSLVLANTLVGVTDPDYTQVQARLRPPQFDDMPHDFQELSPAYRHLNPAGAARWNSLASKAVVGEPFKLTTANQIDWKAISQWRLPVLLMTGDADLYMPPSVMRLFGERIHGAKQFLVPECGHSAFWEQPEIFNDVVLDFVADHPGIQR